MLQPIKMKSRKHPFDNFFCFFGTFCLFIGTILWFVLAFFLLFYYTTIATRSQRFSTGFSRLIRLSCAAIILLCWRCNFHGVTAWNISGSLVCCLLSFRRMHCLLCLAPAKSQHLLSKPVAVLSGLPAKVFQLRFIGFQVACWPVKFCLCCCSGRASSVALFTPSCAVTQRRFQARTRRSELVFIAKRWYNRRYEKRVSSNKLRKWFDRQTMGSNQRILSIRK